MKEVPVQYALSGEFFSLTQRRGMYHVPTYIDIDTDVYTYAVFTHFTYLYLLNSILLGLCVTGSRSKCKCNKVVVCMQKYEFPVPHVI